jgi:hypothetical protein
VGQGISTHSEDALRATESPSLGRQALRDVDRRRTLLDRMKVRTLTGAG